MTGGLLLVVPPVGLSMETIITLLVIPAFMAVTGALVYLWKNQSALQKELLAEKTARIEALEADGKRTTEKMMGLQTEIHQAQIQLAKLETQLLLLKGSNDSSPLPTWMKDTRGVVLICNLAYERIFLQPRGHLLSDYVGHTDNDVWPDHISQQFRSNDDAVIRTGEILDTVEHITTPSGKDLPCRVIKWPRKNGDTVIGVDGLAVPADLSAWTTP